MNEWKKSTEQLPPIDRAVLVYNKDEPEMTIAKLKIMDFPHIKWIPKDTPYWEISDPEGTRCALADYGHWCELPEPPTDSLSPDTPSTETE